MHSMKQLQDFTKVQTTQFELTKDVLLRLKEFDLTPVAKLVLLYLTSCYNPNNSNVIFPKITTISEMLGISETSTKQAIKDLISNGCILKTKQSKAGNNNKYLLTSKVIDKIRLVKSTKSDLLKVQNPTVSCIKQKKETKKEHQQDDFSFNSSFKGNKRKTTLADVPEHIKENKKILNPCAYWHSLNEEEKKQQLEKAKQIEEKKQKALENQKRLEEEERKKAEERKTNEEWNKLPLNEKFSKEQAIKHVWCLRKFIKRMKPSGLSADLITLYNLDIDTIMQMSAEEVGIKTENEVKEL